MISLGLNAKNPQNFSLRVVCSYYRNLFNDSLEICCYVGGMDLIDTLKVAFRLTIYLSCFLLPIGFLFLVKPSMPGWIRKGKVLAPLALYLVFNVYELIDGRFRSNIDNYNPYPRIAVLHLCYLVIYTGFLEFIWCVFHKQISFSLKKNIQRNLLSTLLIITSFSVFLGFLVFAAIIVFSGH